MAKRKPNPEIVRYKLTNRNKDGSFNKNGAIKLVGLDADECEHYIKFVTVDFAYELLDNSTRNEVIDDMDFSTFGEMPW